jgi:hypothetical protein
MLRRSGIAAIALLAVAAASAHGQSATDRRLPFMALAGSAGPVGFTAGGASQVALGGYGYVALSRLILGAQAGRTTSASPDVIYGMGTLGWPARAIRQSLVYPFVGAGRGVLHSNTGLPRRSSAVFGAGVGADQIMARDGFGLLVGFRGGYLFRPGDIGERAIYFTIAAGLGGQRFPDEKKPPIIVAQRHTNVTERAP